MSFLLSFLYLICIDHENYQVVQSL